jgi:tetratricopeptide (TPR) repeat protein
MKHRIARHGIKLAALLCAATTAQADYKDAGRYIMTVYSDMAQGRAILDGEAGELIEKLDENRSGKAFTLEENNNLCVAFTQASQVDNARTACDAAVLASAERTQRTHRFHSKRSLGVRRAKTGQAVALANRGVLYALTGELDAARELFEMALELDSKMSQIKTNLALLEEDLAAAN